MTNTRRKFLKDISLGAGGFLLTPLLQAVERQANGNPGALPSRFVFMVKNSGIWPESITPLEFLANGSNAINASLLKATLPVSMALCRVCREKCVKVVTPAILAC
jgi:hypothetical protein